MAAPGCYGYATVCIKLYSYKCDMYATFVCQRATACPHAPAVPICMPDAADRSRGLDAPPAPRARRPPRPGKVAARYHSFHRLDSCHASVSYTARGVRSAVRGRTADRAVRRSAKRTTGLQTAHSSNKPVPYRRTAPLASPRPRKLP
jgi:hypothetical protein